MGLVFAVGEQGRQVDCCLGLAVLVDGLLGRGYYFVDGTFVVDGVLVLILFVHLYRVAEEQVGHDEIKKRGK